MGWFRGSSKDDGIWGGRKRGQDSEWNKAREENDLLRQMNKSPGSKPNTNISQKVAKNAVERGRDDKRSREKAAKEQKRIDAAQSRRVKQQSRGGSGWTSGGGSKPRGGNAGRPFGGGSKGGGKGGGSMLSGGSGGSRGGGKSPLSGGGGSRGGSSSSKSKGSSRGGKRLY